MNCETDTVYLCGFLELVGLSMKLSWIIKNKLSLCEGDRETSPEGGGRRVFCKYVPST